jgi:hypothetical protein
MLIFVVSFTPELAPLEPRLSIKVTESLPTKLSSGKYWYWIELELTWRCILLSLAFIGGVSIHAPSSSPKLPRFTINKSPALISIIFFRSEVNKCSLFFEQDIRNETWISKTKQIKTGFVFIVGFLDH